MNENSHCLAQKSVAGGVKQIKLDIVQMMAFPRAKSGQVTKCFWLGSPRNWRVLIIFEKYSTNSFQPHRTFAWLVYQRSQKFSFDFNTVIRENCIKCEFSLSHSLSIAMRYVLFNESSKIYEDKYTAKFRCGCENLMKYSKMLFRSGTK